MLRTTVFAIVLSATPALAEVTLEQRALANKSMLSWSAFECSVLAENMGDPVEQERLFLLGHKEGMAFLRALEAEELPKEAVQKYASLKFIWRLGGPSHDFLLGRIYEAAAEGMYSYVLTATDDLVQRTQALREFDRRNCGLLQ